MGGSHIQRVYARDVTAEQIPRAACVYSRGDDALSAWFPFHSAKFYWSRAVMVPLSVLCSLAKARNPRRIGIGELFTTSPAEERNWFPVRSRMNQLFLCGCNGAALRAADSAAHPTVRDSQSACLGHGTHCW